MAMPSPDVWRERVVQMLASGLPLKHWAMQNEVSYDALGSWARRLWRDEPELFVLTRKLCPCPLMAKLLAYRDPQVREYLKCVWFELDPDGAVKSAPSRRRSFDLIAAALGPASSKDSVNLEFLRAVSAGDSRSGETSKSHVQMMGAAVLAGVVSGVNDGDPFFAWVEGNEGLIRDSACRSSLLRHAVEGGRYERIRLIRYAETSAKRAGSVAAIEFDTSDRFCMDLLDGFIAAQEGAFTGREWSFFAHFTESLGFTPGSLEDFTPETFGRQARWFRESLRGTLREVASTTVKRFYMHLMALLPEDQQTFTFETGLPPKALGYGQIVSRWIEGYRAVAYEPLEPVPQSPMWLLYPSKNEVRKASYGSGSPRCVDCRIGDPALEALLMSWLWKGGLDSCAVRTAPYWVKTLLRKVIDDESSVVSAEGVARIVKPESVGAAVALMTKGKSPVSAYKQKSALRAFLAFAEREGALSVEPACYLLLAKENNVSPSHLSPSDDAPAVPAESLSVLAGELERMGERSVGDELTYIAYVTQALTEIRLGEVLSLRVSDLGASLREGIKAVRVCRKSGGYGYEVIQVPGEVHRLLEAAVRITESARAKADESIADRVFLVESASGAVRVLSRVTCAGRMARACKRLGMPVITPRDVRRTYQTTVIMEGAKRHWGRMILRPITGHSDISSDEHYIAPDIMSPETRRYLEGAYVVEIGSPKVRGEVLPDAEVCADAASLVERGAGVCRNEECDVLGTLPCFECRGFATAPRFIPEMVELVAAIDAQLGAARLHQREHLMRAKKHALAYLGIMVDMNKKREGLA